MSGRRFLQCVALALALLIAYTSADQESNIKGLRYTLLRISSESGLGLTAINSRSPGSTFALI